MYAPDNDRTLVTIDSPSAENDVSRVLTRMASGEQIQTQAGVADALARVAVAQEQTKMAASLAQCMVRMKELDVMGNVEKTRLCEDGSTERCRIKEEHQSQRFARLANVWDLSTTENAITERAATEVKEETKRQAVAAIERVEVARVEAQANALNYFSVILALAGLFSVRSLFTWMVPFGSRRRRGGLPWFSLIILCCSGGGWASCRYWFSSESARPNRWLLWLVRNVIRKLWTSVRPTSLARLVGVSHTNKGNALTTGMVLDKAECHEARSAEGESAREM